MRKIQDLPSSSIRLRGFPAGVSHDLRIIEPFSVSIAKGDGPQKWDVDGNEYVDFGLGSGSFAGTRPSSHC